jgi:hypothetical protein
VDQAPDLGDVGADQLAPPFAHRARDHDDVDVATVGPLDDRADSVVERQVVDVLGADGDQVRVLARRQRPDAIGEPDCPRALDRGELEHVAVADERRRVVLASIHARARVHALRRQRRSHLGEHVARERDLHVSAEARAQPQVQHRLNRRPAAADADLLVGCGGERDVCP